MKRIVFVVFILTTIFFIYKTTQKDEFPQSEALKEAIPDPSKEPVLASKEDGGNKKSKRVVKRVTQTTKNKAEEVLQPKTVNYKALSLLKDKVAIPEHLQTWFSFKAKDLKTAEEQAELERVLTDSACVFKSLEILEEAYQNPSPLLSLLLLNHINEAYEALGKEGSVLEIEEKISHMIVRSFEESQRVNHRSEFLTQRVFLSSLFRNHNPQKWKELKSSLPNNPYWVKFINSVESIDRNAFF
jgi:hypothetical protein